MNKLEQAARQALEALEELSDISEAVIALREALAEQAEQEPVAWMWVSEQGSERLEWESVQDISKWKSTPLYTSPVRTKDLTDDEIEKVGHQTLGDAPLNCEYEFARAVIAADREKNK